MNEHSGRPMLGAAFDPRSNSIGALRLIAATMVVVGHASVYGGYGIDPLESLTHNQIAIGRWPVDVFFVMSGFLLTLSFSRTSLSMFMRNRVLRIFPAFWVCLLLSGFVIPPFFGITPNLWYVARSVSLVGGIADRIPGLYADHPILSINGSLWTLQWEFYCYLSLPLMNLLGLLQPKRSLLVFAIFLACYWTEILRSPVSDMMPISSGLRLFTFFYAGVALWQNRDHVPASGRLGIGAIALLGALTAVGTVLVPRAGGLFYMAAPMLLSYAVMIGAAKLGWTRLNSRTDISYGVYIYGAPVLQLLYAAGLHAGRVAYPVYLAAALAVTFGLGWLSWAFVEHPALKLKSKRAPIVTATAGAP